MAKRTDYGKHTDFVGERVSLNKRNFLSALFRTADNSPYKGANSATYGQSVAEFASPKFATNFTTNEFAEDLVPSIGDALPDSVKNLSGAPANQYVPNLSSPGNATLGDGFINNNPIVDLNPASAESTIAIPVEVIKTGINIPKPINTGALLQQTSFTQSLVKGYSMATATTDTSHVAPLPTPGTGQLPK